MIDALIQPFQFAFMNNAFLIMAMISVPMALLSCYLVLKGWSLMGDAISHAVLPGVVLAYLLNIPLIIGAFCAGMFCALATGFLQQNSRVKQDTVMGIVFSGMFGLECRNQRFLFFHLGPRIFKRTHKKGCRTLGKLPLRLHIFIDEKRGELTIHLLGELRRIG